MRTSTNHNSSFPHQGPRGPQAAGTHSSARLGAGILALLGAALWGGPGHAANPQGPEFRLNSTVVDTQSVFLGLRHGRAVARNGTSGTIAVWQSRQQDSSGYGVFAQRYDPSGLPVGGEFQVNQTTLGFQGEASLAAENGGNFVIVWSGSGPGDGDGIFARVYNATGSPLTSEFLVNATTTGSQIDPDVAIDNSGDFVVTWSGQGPGDAQAVMVRIFSSNGTALTNEVRANVDTTGVQRSPAVASDTNLDFVVAWENQDASGQSDVLFQRFNAAGVPQGNVVRAHDAATGNQLDPSVSRASNESFVVAWEDDPGTGDRDVYFRRFSSIGTALGAQTLAHPASNQVQMDPFVAVDGGGEFLIVWCSDEDPSSGVDWNIILQQFSKDGFPVGTPLRANTTVAGPQVSPSVALDDVNQFIVVWAGNGVGDSEGVFGRFFGLQPNADIALTQTVSPSLVYEGDTVRFTITATNNGADVGTGITVTDTLPPGLTYVSDLSSDGTYSSVTGQWQLLSLAPSSSAVLRLTATVDPGTAGSTLSNTASLTAIDQIDPVASNNSSTIDVVPTRNLVLLSASQSAATLHPAQAAVPVMALTVTSASTVAETLQALSLTNRSTGPGTQDELDAEWGDLQLRLEGASISLATSRFVTSHLRFDGFDLPIAAGDSVTLEVLGAPTTVARDGDFLDLRMDSSSDLELVGSPPVVGSFPLDPNGVFLVDGMTAAQIALHEVPANSFLTGSQQNLAFDITLPANGYAVDVLQKLNIFNHGTARQGLEIQNVQAWIDDGDDQFQAGRERLLGTLVFTGNRWELTGLAEPVFVSGLHVYFTVDISAAAQVGRTIRLGLSGDPDVPIGMASGNDGPIDGTVSNRFAQSISTADRVTLSSVGVVGGPVRPGQSSVPMLQIVATNTYGVTRTLGELTLTNVTVSSNGGTTDQRDREIENLHLFTDSNDNGMLDAEDAELATSFFSLGRATFRGLSWSIPPGASRHLFVTADVPLQEAADGDVLGLHLEGALDLKFQEPTALAAAWPLDSGARWTIDGMVAAQVQNRGALGITLGPNEGPALALDLLVPANGYAGDTLRGLSVVNRGTASFGDIADLRLWRDGGDGVFTPGTGDDREIAPLVVVDDAWKSPQLNEPIPVNGLRIFVSATISATPFDYATIRLGVPLLGIQTVSGNDGPVDVAIVNEEELLLSTAPLSVSLHASVSACNVGQDFLVNMNVRNVSDETISDITASALTIMGSGGLTLIASPSGPVASLAPGGTANFQWTYRGAAVGSVQLSGEAQGLGTGGLVRRSIPDVSGLVQVRLQANEIAVQAVGTAPLTINRGEIEVVPLSLTFTHEGESNTSNAVLRSLRLRVEDDEASGIIPADILSKLVLREGSRTYYQSDSLPSSGAEIFMTLSSPLVITPEEPSTVSFLCDIQDSTLVPVFRLAIEDADAFVVEDATDGSSVGVVTTQGSFPILSGLGQVRAAPERLDVEALPAMPLTVGQAQEQVTLLPLKLTNPGVPNLTTSVRVGALQLCITDSNGVALEQPGRFFHRLRLRSSGLTLDEQDLAAQTDSVISFLLSVPALVQAGLSNDLILVGDVADDAPLGTIHLRLGDPAGFDARDDNTHAPVPVVYATDPIESAPITIQSRAETLRVASTARFPTNLIVGETNRLALSGTLRHPGAIGEGSISLEGWTFTCRDEARRPLSLAAYLDQVRILVGSPAETLLANATQFPDLGSMTIWTSEITLSPGQELAFQIEVSFEPNAPTRFFELLVTDFPRVRDRNLGTPVDIVPEPGAEMPLSSGLTKLGAPATELVVGLESLIPAVLALDGSPVLVARLSLSNSAALGSGSVAVDRLVLRAGDRDRLPLALGAAATQILLRLDGGDWLQSGNLTPDSTTVSFVPTDPLMIEAASTTLLDVVVIFAAEAPSKGFRLRLDAADLRVLQPSGTSIPVRVQAASGQAFPLWSEAGSFGAVSLQESFANFPNPFAAGNESTTFTYYMPQAGKVTLRILTPRGEQVITLLDNEPRAAGLHQNLLWNGKNERSRIVLNGVYVAELRVHLDDGSSARILRKVAVVR